MKKVMIVITAILCIGAVVAGMFIPRMFSNNSDYEQTAVTEKYTEEKVATDQTEEYTTILFGEKSVDEQNSVEEEKMEETTVRPSSPSQTSAVKDNTDGKIYVEGSENDIVSGGNFQWN